MSKLALLLFAFSLQQEKEWACLTNPYCLPHQQAENQSLTHQQAEKQGTHPNLACTAFHTDFFKCTDYWTFDILLWYLNSYKRGKVIALASNGGELII